MQKPNRDLNTIWSPFLSSGKLEDANDDKKSSHPTYNSDDDDRSEDSGGFWH